MRLLVWLLTASFLAGCVTDGAAPASVAPGPAGASAEPAGMAVGGVVQTTAFRPVEGAGIRLTLPRGDVVAAATSDAGGRFLLDGLDPTVYLLDVEAEGFSPRVLRVGPTSMVALDIQLAPAAGTQPHHETVLFRGHLECGAEALIITGPCDAVVTYAGGPALTDDESLFDLDVGPGWRTLVGDLVFDGEGHPGVDGLRVTVQGLHNGSALTDYEQYARFHGPDAFTFRMEPGAEHPGGVAPTPGDATTFRFHVYPQGHGWHSVCSPDGTCFLGGGAVLDMEFRLYVTMFYVEPAPQGWNLRGA